MKKVFVKPARIWIFLLSVVVMSMTGCGNIDWFPEYVRPPTTPDQFTFTNKTGTQQNVRVTSNSITVAGLTAATSPISVSGGTDSKYSVNGGAETSAAGTVKNGDKVTVSHTSANTIDTATITTLQIGDVTGKFTSWTRLVEVGTFDFSTIPQPGPVFTVFAIVTSKDTNGHVLSITDTGTANTASYWIADANGGSPTPARTPSSTDLTISVLNNQRIYVTKERTTTTKLIIDNVEYPVTVPAQ